MRNITETGFEYRKRNAIVVLFVAALAASAFSTACLKKARTKDVSYCVAGIQPSSYWKDREVQSPDGAVLCRELKELAGGTSLEFIHYRDDPKQDESQFFDTYVKKFTKAGWSIDRSNESGGTSFTYLSKGSDRIFLSLKNNFPVTDDERLSSQILVSQAFDSERKAGYLR